MECSSRACSSQACISYGLPGIEEMRTLLHLQQIDRFSSALSISLDHHSQQPPQLLCYVAN